MDKKQIMKEMAKGCSMYQPCPICFKCEVKASHLYTRCQNCEVPFDAHDHKAKSFIIRRENFAVTLSNETAGMLKQMSAKADSK